MYFRYQCIHWNKFENDEVDRILSCEYTVVYCDISVMYAMCRRTEEFGPTVGLLRQTFGRVLERARPSADTGPPYFGPPNYGGSILYRALGFTLQAKDDP